MSPSVCSAFLMNYSSLSPRLTYFSTPPPRTTNPVLLSSRPSRAEMWYSLSLSHPTALHQTVPQPTFNHSLLPSFPPGQRCVTHSLQITSPLPSHPTIPHHTTLPTPFSPPLLSSWAEMCYSRSPQNFPTPIPPQRNVPHHTPPANPFLLP